MQIRKSKLNSDQFSVLDERVKMEKFFQILQYFFTLLIFKMKIILLNQNYWNTHKLFIFRTFVFTTYYNKKNQ